MATSRFSVSNSGFSENRENSLAENNQHFSLFFLDDSNDELEDVEVTKAVAKNGKFFDPVVGGRNSTRSSSSRSSAGSTGFSDQVLESSPTNSLSPYAFDHEIQDDNILGQVMTNFHQMSLKGDMGCNTKRLTNISTSSNSGQREILQLQQQQTPHIQSWSNLSGPSHHQQGPPTPLSRRSLMHYQYLNQEQNQTQLMANLAALAGVMAPSVANPQNNPSLWAPGPLTQENMGLNNFADKPATMQIRCKFGSLGELERQFHSPHGFCMGPNEEIIVADTFNHRIQIFDKEGNFKFSFGIPGKDEGQLFYPRKVAVLRNSGYYVICDRGSERSRMQIFSPMGHFIRRIPIRFIDIVAGLAISREGYIVAVDSVTPTIFILHENGELIKYIECSEYMTEPSDIAIFGHEYYICDFKGHSIVVMHENGNFLRRIGCQPVTNFPNGIDISDAGDILVGDSHGNQFHVAVYDRRGELISQFQCPQVKVSRCCGLKITSEGYIVTLAKNNHHVLILNTLYVP